MKIKNIIGIFIFSLSAYAGKNDSATEVIDFQEQKVQEIYDLHHDELLKKKSVPDLEKRLRELFGPVMGNNKPYRQMAYQMIVNEAQKKRMAKKALCNIVK